jgi:hypothetical protein
MKTGDAVLTNARAILVIVNLLNMLNLIQDTHLT